MSEATSHTSELSEATSQTSESHNTHSTVEQEPMPSASVHREVLRLPLHSAVFEGRGHRLHMQDTHIARDHVDGLPMPAAFYAVFDGHGESEHAAKFAMQHLLQNFITSLMAKSPSQKSDFLFPDSYIMDALTHSFQETDLQFRDFCQKNAGVQSGTTAIAAVILERSLIVANAGDCRAVLCRNGKALELSDDHDPILNNAELRRIKEAGGYLVDGYLMDCVNMSRAIGDWHHPGLKRGDKGELGPLISTPEIMCKNYLKGEDEFMIIASDGLFKHCSSHKAVDFVRAELKKHDDLTECAKDLARYGWSVTDDCNYYRDNSTVVIVRFEEVTIATST